MPELTNEALLRGTEAIPVSVLTGFLGSGKTTLLNQLLPHKDMAGTVVLINEFGEIGLDHLLVEKIDEQIVLLKSGCLCCTVRGDLVNSLRDLFARRLKGDIPVFRRVAIETTGLADPVPIVHTLLSDPSLSERYAIGGVATTVDACHVAGQLSAHPESVKQVALADRLIVTKLDCSGAPSLQEVATRLRRLNPEAIILDSRQVISRPLDVLAAGAFDQSRKSKDAQNWLASEGEHSNHSHLHRHDVNRHDERIRSLSLKSDVPIDADRFSTWLQDLLERHGENILRVKGIMNFSGERLPIAIHGVQHIFYPPLYLNAWAGDPCSRVVFIVRDIKPDEIAQSFSTEFQSASPQ